MNETEYVFNLYKQYLVQLAFKEGRPISMPKTTTSLMIRTDIKFFYALSRKLQDKSLKNKKQVSVFMETARKSLTYFYISNVVTEFEDIYEKYKLVKEDSTREIVIKIKKAFAFLKEYCIINSINSYEGLLKGSPPIILKLWKSGKIDERVLVSLFDFESVKKKPWYRIYCVDLASKITSVHSEIRKNGDVFSVMESELVKFKESFLINKE